MKALSPVEALTAQAQHLCSLMSAAKAALRYQLHLPGDCKHVCCRNTYGTMAMLVNIQHSFGRHSSTCYAADDHSDKSFSLFVQSLSGRQRAVQSLVGHRGSLSVLAAPRQMTRASLYRITLSALGLDLMCMLTRQLAPSASHTSLQAAG